MAAAHSCWERFYHLENKYGSNNHANNPAFFYFLIWTFDSQQNLQSCIVVTLRNWLAQANYVAAQLGLCSAC